MRRSAQGASVACRGLTFADLAWAACFGCTDAARSSRCRPFAAPHPADRCISAIADQVFRLRFDHVEVEAQLYQTHFVMVRRVRADQERQSMAVLTSQCLDR